MHRKFGLTRFLINSNAFLPILKADTVIVAYFINCSKRLILERRAESTEDCPGMIDAIRYCCSIFILMVLTIMRVRISSIVSPLEMALSRRTRVADSFINVEEKWVKRGCGLSVHSLSAVRPISIMSRLMNRAIGSTIRGLRRRNASMTSRTNAPARIAAATIGDIDSAISW